MANKSIIIGVLILLAAALISLGISPEEVPAEDKPVAGMERSPVITIEITETEAEETPLEYEDRAELRREQKSPDTFFDRKNPFYKKELRFKGLIC